MIDTPKIGSFMLQADYQLWNFVIDTQIDNIMGENLRVPDEGTKGIVESTMDRRLDVYVWDMDETLILLKSLLNGTYAEAFNGSKDLQKGLEIGKMWEKHILDLCDGYFFYEQVFLPFSCIFLSCIVICHFFFNL